MEYGRRTACTSTSWVLQDHKDIWYSNVHKRCHASPWPTTYANAALRTTHVPRGPRTRPFDATLPRPLLAPIICSCPPRNWRASERSSTITSMADASKSSTDTPYGDPLPDLVSGLLPPSSTGEPFVNKPQSNKQGYSGFASSILNDHGIINLSSYTLSDTENCLLTHWGRVTHICVVELGHHRFR